MVAVDLVIVAIFPEGPLDGPDNPGVVIDDTDLDDVNRSISKIKPVFKERRSPPKNFD